MDLLNQFIVVPIFNIRFLGFDISFTNSALLMLMTALSSSIILSARNKVNLVPNFIQSINEIIYNFISNLTRQYLKDESDKYIPFFMALFIFIAMGNLFGLLPKSFTFTSHLISTFSLAMFVFALSVFAGFKKHGLKLFSLFAPRGVPKLMLPLVFLIEFSLFFVKPFVMALRLCVNMIAGHIILKVVLHYSTTLFLIKFIPIFGYSAMLLFECAVAIFQAYIFVLLSCISLKDVLYLH
ncbi:F0F1 ATP synthase subunit A [Candidatus Cytomitobacter indipagum]|uniref:ATP synthase subunit a n=1 Tax=Candidatus Cytomitobacter indipagum TaxID=2601575 RepID=A0A5C0UEA9_9PROT|nr:F0F1 ATP synthase subunit A [Candidatus Cytomitobacter indipagum]QEK38021.1 F0F1 ATP synthase subunit A [Candidatus Cytomitobacter indipagum]